MAKRRSTADGVIPMTRRGFLERFGAVDGSTLVMSAMASWDLLGEQAGPQARPDGQAERHQGDRARRRTVRIDRRATSSASSDTTCACSKRATGSVASHWTVRKGAEHTEIGGENARSAPSTRACIVNAGPGAFPHFHTGVLEHCKELNVPLQVFINEAEASHFYYESKSIGPLAGKRVRLREVKADMIGYTGELLAKAIDQSKLDLPLTTEDKERLVTSWSSRDTSTTPGYAYKRNDVRGPGDPYDFSRAAAVRIREPDALGHAADGTGADVSTDRRHGPVPRRRFSSRSANRLTLGAEVQSVHQTTDGVKVVYTRHEERTEARRSLPTTASSCMPLSVLSDARRQSVAGDGSGRQRRRATAPAPRWDCR